ncbi:MAG: MerR family transcriptional regulator [Arachnia sp.]
MADQATDPTGESLQGLLFDGDFAPLPTGMGFRGPVAHRVAGITYRQLDYWARTGLVTPELRQADGSGTQRLYSFRDVLLLRVVKRFLDIGISLQQIRVAIDHLRSRGAADLTELTLVSDGFSVYEVTSANELFDLTRGGQGMFMISVSSVWREIEGTIQSLPAERVVSADESHPSDELAARRRNRAV